MPLPPHVREAESRKVTLGKELGSLYSMQDEGMPMLQRLAQHFPQVSAQYIDPYVQLREQFMAPLQQDIASHVAGMGKKFGHGAGSELGAMLHDITRQHEESAHAKHYERGMEQFARDMERNLSGVGLHRKLDELSQYSRIAEILRLQELMERYKQEEDIARKATVERGQKRWEWPMRRLGKALKWTQPLI
jgi:hypothetical protein